LSLAALVRGDEPFLVLPAYCGSLHVDHISTLMQPSIAVIVLSSDRIFCEVLAASLSRREGLEAIAAPAGAQDMSGESSPGVVLIDASFHPQSALSQTWEVRALWPDAKIVAIGLDREDDQIVDFAEAGALGSPRILAAVVARITSLSRVEVVAPVGHQVEPLTLREREILALMAEGLSNKEVGRRLRITVQTVKNHVHRILEKLQCHRRREAVRLAYDLGLLMEPGEGTLAAGPIDAPRKGNGGLDPF
jgi:two-component system nitrate/nitrite response regulator NarL